MAKHTQRSPLTGRFASTKNSPEATAGDFATYAAGLPVDNVSGAPSDATHDVPRHGPSADSEQEPPGHRRPVEIDGKHPSPKTRLHLWAAGDVDYLRYIMGGE